MSDIDTKSNKLNAKQRLFVQEYLSCLNASEAARRAGYKGRANTVGRRLLSNGVIKEIVNNQLKERLVDADKVIDMLKEQITADLSNFVVMAEEPVLDRKGNYVGDRQVIHVKQEFFEKYGYLVKGIYPARGGGFSVELYDKQKAIELIGKHYGLFVDKIDFSGLVSPTINNILIVIKNVIGDNSLKSEQEKYNAIAGGITALLSEGSGE